MPQRSVESEQKHVAIVTTNLKSTDDEHLILLMYRIDACFGCQDSIVTKKRM